MKKILIFLLMIPFIVSAKSSYLYDVLKNAAQEGTYAKQYTGTHHDSFTEEPTKNIYHWYASNDTSGNRQANEILEKNNVLFGGFCWQMIRTTDTGGVKMIYNGVPSSGICNNTGNNQQIGVSTFDQFSSKSLADVGYMYNTRYTYLSKTISYRQEVLTSQDLSVNYWYADSVIWNTSINKWELVNPFKVSSQNDYLSLEGKYSFYKSSESYSSSVVNYISGISGYNSYNVKLENGHDLSYYEDTYLYGTDYTDNGNGTYTINGSGTFTTSQYKNNANTNKKDKYYCINPINNTCSNLIYIYYIDSGGFNYYKVSDEIRFGSSFNYRDGKYTLSGDFLDTWTFKSNVDNDLNNYHYTCLNKTGVCNTVYYVFELVFGAAASNQHVGLYYIELNNGKNITNALNEMLYNDNVNTNSSTIKTYIDNWYQNNLVDYGEFLEDTIFCNDRSQKNYTSNGWNPAGGNVKTRLVFNSVGIKCPNDSDKFSIFNNKAKLTYPIGLLTRQELDLLKNNNLRKTGTTFWTMSPYVSWVNPNYISYYSAKKYTINQSGAFTSLDVENNSSYGVRPVISLKPNIVQYSGNGSKNNPYLVRMPISNNITINNENNKGTISNLDNTNNIEELSSVTFTITPKTGYIVNRLEIIDSNNESIDYEKDGDIYSFIMPDSDITITPIYEKVKSSINVEIVNETEDINIELNDLTQVEYEEEVNFTIKPIKGYKVKSIIIKDSNNNNIDFTKNNNTYTFTMPSTNVTIIPSYERVSNNISINDNEGTKEFRIDVNDASAVVYEDKVVFTIVPKEEYELKRIDIIDEEDNKINYSKTNKENEYEFIMPSTNVTITPIYSFIYKFIEGMGQDFNTSNDTNLRFKVNMDYDEFIKEGKVYIDNKEIDRKYYELKRGSTIIIINDEYSKQLSLGKHEIVTKLKDGSSCKTDFTIKESIIDNPIINKIINPNTGDTIILILIVLLISLGINRYLKLKKNN